MTHDQNAAMVIMMRDGIRKKLDEKEVECDRLAKETSNDVKKLSSISQAIAYKEAEVIVLNVAAELMRRENDELLREINEMIEKAMT